MTRMRRKALSAFLVASLTVVAGCGDAALLTARHVAVHAFGKPADFDASQTASVRVEMARLRRAEINRVGAVPQSNHLLSTGPQLWWVAEGLLKQPFRGGNVELALGLEHRKDRLTDDTDLEPRGYLRGTQAF